MSERLRLDKWLFFARVMKSRTLAQKLITGGGVRVDGTRVTGSDFAVSPGMVLTMIVHERLRILKIVALGTRRGPASEAVTLFEDISPPIEKRSEKEPPPGIDRPKGSGRPTKKERREMEAFTRSKTDSG